MIENKNKIFGLSPCKKGDYFEESDENERTFEKELDRILNDICSFFKVPRHLVFNYPTSNQE
jgi:hypothetical protein